MARFQITGPDGHTYEINAPEGASEQEILAYAQQQFGGRGPAEQPAAPAETSRIGSALTGIGQGLTFGWGDEMAAGLAATVKRPFSDQSWREIYDEQLAIERGNLSAAREQHPVITGAGEIAGAVGTGTGLARGGASLVGGAKSIPGAIGRGAAEGAAYGAAYGAGAAEEGERIEGAAKGGAMGAVTGGAIGGVVGAVAGRGRSPVPGLDELREQATAAYKAAENAGVVIHPSSFKSAVTRIGNRAAQEGLDPTLHPRATAALKRLTEVDGPVTFEQAETLRRVVKNAASSLQPDERRIVYMMTEQLDDYIGRLKPGDVLSGDPQVATEAIRTARGLWSRLSKGEVLEELTERAQNRAGQFSGSGYENALRTEFRNLIQNPRRLRQFNAQEQEALKRVARGAPVENALRMLGKAAPTGIVSGVLGGGAGYAIGGPVGAAAVMAGGGAARKGARMMTERNAQIAAEMMRRGGPAEPLNQLVLRGGTPAITGVNALGAAGPSAYDALTR